MQILMIIAFMNLIQFEVPRNGNGRMLRSIGQFVAEVKAASEDRLDGVDPHTAEASNFRTRRRTA